MGNYDDWPVAGTANDYLQRQVTQIGTVRIRGNKLRHHYAMWLEAQCRHELC